MTQWGLDNLFNPGKRHMDDEKRRLQSTREEIGDASGGRRIDLESGVVSISLPGKRRDPEPSADDDAAAASADGSTSEPLPAAIEDDEVPAVALRSDAEIEPPVEVVTEDEPPAARAPAAEAAPSESVEEPTPAPKRSMSAKAWARRG